MSGNRPRQERKEGRMKCRNDKSELVRVSVWKVRSDLRHPNWLFAKFGSFRAPAIPEAAHPCGGMGVKGIKEQALDANAVFFTQYYGLPYERP